MKILPVEKIREADTYTITNEPIAALDLMERAARQIYNWFSKHIEKDSNIVVFCGTGNNGGDGLVVSRHLLQNGYTVHTY
ncbi:MAG: NAD(P)H-hydrate epimerase, partial [Bacteroidales bacterium]|nr:NAD(P)H-hydrate epimerase [Bacteroidales bacterium]